jgi:hypothetical protein
VELQLNIPVCCARGSFFFLLFFLVLGERNEMKYDVDAHQKIKFTGILVQCSGVLLQFTGVLVHY